jgi:hypothetical protein
MGHRLVPAVLAPRAQLLSARPAEFAEFRGGSSGAGLVFVAQVAPWRVLARYNLYDERECVVDTRGLVMSLMTQIAEIRSIPVRTS